MKHELGQMRTQGSGAIVNCSSLGGLVGLPGRAAYHASKHGVIGLTTSAALEYAPRGIRINAVCPGTIETPMVTDMIAKGELDPAQAAAATPIGRLGQGEEIAASVLWLCSPGASFIIGMPYPSTAAADRSAASDPVEPRHAVRPAIRWPAAAASADGASPGEAQTPRAASGRRPEHLPQCWNRCNRFRSTTRWSTSWWWMSGTVSRSGGRGCAASGTWWSGRSASRVCSLGSMRWCATAVLLFRSQFAVLCLEIKNHADAGEVQPGVQQVGDPPQPVQVVGAVAAGATLGALGLEQSACLIGPQFLHAHADQLRGDRDAVHAALPPWPGHSDHRRRPFLSHFSCGCLLPSACHVC
jgi:hypothetical protein